MYMALSREFFDRDPPAVACELLGKVLTRHTRKGVMKGRIVETEAYLGQGDEASHTACGKTRRNASMFGPPGIAYVYTIHARFCFNVVTESAGTGSAVLIRALEPLTGIQQMRERRRRCVARDLTRGPARLCEAFGLNRDWDGWDLTLGKRLWISRGDVLRSGAWAQSSRIGISQDKELPLRFFLTDNRFISGPSRLNRP